jgi:putative acetyltransferase
MALEGLTIRRATADDAQRRDRIHYSAVHGLAAGFYSREQLAGWARRGYRNSREALGNQLAKGDLILIAMVGNRRGGFAELSGDYVRAVYVSRKYARCGVGAALLAAVECEAAARGVEELRLESSVNAVGFYLARGYRVIREKMHRFSNGTEIECAEMIKRV